MASAVPPAERPQFLLPHMQLGCFVVSQDRMASMPIAMLVDQLRGLVQEASQLGENVRNVAKETNVSLKRMFVVQNAVLLEQASAVLTDFKEMDDSFANIDLFASRS